MFSQAKYLIPSIIVIAGVFVLALIIVAVLRNGPAPADMSDEAIARRIAPIGSLNTGEPVAATAEPAASAPAEPPVAATPAPAEPAAGGMPAEQPPVAAAPAPEEPAAASAPAGRSGEAVYKAACVACHAVGVAGAPKTGDAQAWAPRVEKGMETLLKNAVTGINAMPPRGTCGNCSDEELMAAIEYMISQSR